MNQDIWNRNGNHRGPLFSFICPAPDCGLLTAEFFNPNDLIEMWERRPNQEVGEVKMEITNREKQLLEAKAELLRTLKDLVGEIGPCTCHEAYIDRRLTDPNCKYCTSFAESAHEIILKYEDK